MRKGFHVLAFIAASLVASSATASPASALPAGTYAYRFRAGQTELGASTITVQRAPGGVTVHEVATLSGRTFTIDQTLDASGSGIPTRIEALYPSSAPGAPPV